jgi:hypothetical protein
VSPSKVTRRIDSLPTMIDEGVVELKGRKLVKLPASEVVQLEAPEFATLSITVGRVTAMVLKELTRSY